MANFHYRLWKCYAILWSGENVQNSWCGVARGSSEENRRTDTILTRYVTMRIGDRY